jgi:hypothetical protein
VTRAVTTRSWSANDRRRGGQRQSRAHAESFAAGVGFTDVVKRPTATASDLEPRELQHGRADLERKLEAAGAALVIFALKRAATTLLGPFEGNGFLRGLRVGSSEVFVVPGPYENRETATSDPGSAPAVGQAAAQLTHYVIPSASQRSRHRSTGANRTVGRGRVAGSAPAMTLQVGLELLMDVVEDPPLRDHEVARGSAWVDTDIHEHPEPRFARIRRTRLAEFACRLPVAGRLRLDPQGHATRLVSVTRENPRTPPMFAERHVGSATTQQFGYDVVRSGAGCLRVWSALA